MISTLPGTLDPSWTLGIPRVPSGTCLRGVETLGLRVEGAETCNRGPDTSNGQPDES